ncbi:MAG: hypothetical protein V3T72_05390 [Thermoanaerobaculia bacterium]
MKNPLESLAFALEKYPERIEIAPVEELMVDSARQNPKRAAYVKLAVPDEVVKALRGSADKRRDLLMLVQIPKEVLERSESRIILPGEAG